jgi:hypothetical protein
MPVLKEVKRLFLAAFQKEQPICQTGLKKQIQCMENRGLSIK